MMLKLVYYLSFKVLKSFYSSIHFIIIMYLHYLCINWAVNLFNNFIADLLVCYYLCIIWAVSFLNIFYSSFTCVLFLGNYLYHLSINWAVKLWI